ncbi:hypothetical protein HYH03_008406 [Edaphochlamys debaryana]|uniref:BTB domain-containing protein n=1 Tax=Edaphochlamys debaryana TaxID=47281 RepID=A0A836BZD7_9CHLO|nr:hypothetical protein HYH03_008406 [Edaphochlamys debaryana]|eukprot:KAG2493269.1 hypothetical protein HYH03_008406 [Edaphochlamys debaryana]
MGPLTWRPLPLGRKATTLVVRPRPGGGPDQALVFLEGGGIYELECLDNAPGPGAPAACDPQLGPWLGTGAAWRAAYDPSADCVFFAEAASVCQLDASFSTSAVAAVCSVCSAGDSNHAAAPTAPITAGTGNAPGPSFRCISALAADGHGGVWILDDGIIRRLDTRSGRVASLRDARAPSGGWWSLAFDTSSGSLFVATDSALCRVRTEGGGFELLAGSWMQRGAVDGAGAAARFSQITALLPLPGTGRLLVADGPDLRCVDMSVPAGGGGAGGGGGSGGEAVVSMLARGCFGGLQARQMALLPSGELAAVTWPSSPALYLLSGAPIPAAAGDSVGSSAAEAGAEGAGAVGVDMERFIGVLSAPADDAGAEGVFCSGGSDRSSSSDSEGSSGGYGAAASWAVTVRVGDQAFHAHCSVLAAGSEYFARLLAPGGGFAESGAAEVALPDADPTAFAHLLSYMYGTSLGLPCAPSQLLAVPADLLRPTAALAGRMLMDGVVEALTERLAAAACPATVLSDLIWADDHGMTDLVERLKAYALKNRRRVDLRDLGGLVERCPLLVTELLEACFRA